MKDRHTPYERHVIITAHGAPIVDPVEIWGLDRLCGSILSGFYGIILPKAY